MLAFTPWPKIEQFSSVFKTQQLYPYLPPDEKVVYRGKIKLDGTNAGVSFDWNQNTLPQSRQRSLSVIDDNYGFASFCQEMQIEQFKMNLNSNLEQFSFPEKVVKFTLFGEWCGKQIQNSLAISQINKRVFAIFSIQINDNLLIVNPEIANKFCLSIFPNLLVAHDKFEIQILPWYNEEQYIVDFSSSEKTEPTLNRINSEVNKIGQEDPFVKCNYNFSGPGEGLVFYPYSDRSFLAKEIFANIGFKVRCPEKQVIKSKQPAQINPEKVGSIQEFVDLVLTTARLEQGLQNIDSLDKKNTGKFLSWILNDIQTECQYELQESNLKWKDVSQLVSETSRNWYFKQLK